MRRGPRWSLSTRTLALLALWVVTRDDKEGRKVLRRVEFLVPGVGDEKSGTAEEADQNLSFLPAWE